jgi:hypothetical protein
METGFIVAMLLAVLVGITVGFIIGRRKKPNDSQGILYAYCREDDAQPSLLLEGTAPIDEITSKKQVIFDVVVIR